MPDREIVALHPPERMERYGLEVHHQIRRDERDDYARTARALASCADVASIQFQADIWGGEDGEAVLDFVRALPIPVVATLHSIPPDPTRHQREVILGLADGVAATITLSHAAAELLVASYRLDGRSIQVISHGVPDLPASATESSKASLGLTDRDVVLSFGLLAPDKELERMLEALPAIVAAHPRTTYVILGATHPEILRSDGEAYRDRLVAMAAHLGVSDNVRIVNEFPGRNELTRWIQAADVVVSPDAELRRTDSGTLAFAMAAGRAIVATRSAYAREVLAESGGTLVATSPAAIAAAVNRLLGAPGVRQAMGNVAHERSRDMSWTNVGTAYSQLFGAIARPRQPETFATV